MARLRPVSKVIKVIYSFTCPHGHLVSSSKNYRAYAAIDAAKKLPPLLCHECSPEQASYADPSKIRLFFDELEEDWLHDAGEIIEQELPSKDQ